MEAPSEDSLSLHPEEREGKWITVKMLPLAPPRVPLQ